MGVRRGQGYNVPKDRLATPVAAAEPGEDEVLEVVFSHCESSGVQADPLLVADIVRATILALRTAGSKP